MTQIWSTQSISVSYLASIWSMELFVFFGVLPRVYEKEREYSTLYCCVQTLFEEYRGQTDYKYKR